MRRSDPAHFSLRDEKSKTLQVRIGAALVTDPTTGTMAADETDIVSERQDLVADRGEQLRVVASRQIGTANRALEQHVTEMDEGLRAIVVDHVARRVSGAMENLEHMRAKRYPVAIMQPAIRNDVLELTGDTKCLRLGLDPLQQRQVILVRSDDID